VSNVFEDIFIAQTIVSAPGGEVDDMADDPEDEDGDDEKQEDDDLSDDEGTESDGREE